MVNLGFKGHRFRPIVAEVERARLRAFFRAIGETNPAVVEPDASGRIAIPPTYLFCLEMLDAENPLAFLEEIGVPTEQSLHADQTFSYHLPIYVGDRLTFNARVVDIFQKKGGLLTFVIQDVEVLNQDNQLVAEIRRTLVVKQKALPSA
jgi:hydroxyacyl-ACP dehydratase HTD2-like protein with hotdog domain